MKNKKTLASVLAILIALALIAGSTMAWFVVGGTGDTGAVKAGNIAFTAGLLPVNDPSATTSGFYLQNGFVVTYNSDTNLSTDVLLQPGVNWPDAAYDLSDAQCGIVNTGSLSEVIQISNVSLTTTLADGTVMGPGQSGVLCNLIVPPTQNNIDLLDGGSAFISTVDGNTYVMLNPGQTLDAYIQIDMTTNASPSKFYTGPGPLWENTAPLADVTLTQYLGAGYMDCTVSVSDSFVSTQLMDGALLDIFGIADDGNGSIDTLVMASPAYDMANLLVGNVGAAAYFGAGLDQPFTPAV
jgi:hypothetical protein